MLPASCQGQKCTCSSCNFDQSEIIQINLSSCGLKGSLPESIGKLVHLEELFLDRNKIEGTIPAEIGLLTYLRLLWLSTNKLSGNIPEVHLEKLQGLQWLELHNNPQLTGKPPKIQLDKEHFRFNTMDKTPSEKYKILEECDGCTTTYS